MPVRRITGERATLLGVWGIGVLGCFLGLVLAQPEGHPGFAQQAVALVRVFSTTALAVVLVLGPGLALRAGRPRRRLELGYLPLPGLAVLVLVGSVAWALSKAIQPRVTCAVALIPLLAWLLLRVLRAGEEAITSSEERRALLMVAAALGIGVGRALWSLGPPGELLGGTSFRTLEVGDRSDSRVSFGLVQLIANGDSPFSGLARSYFQDSTFSDRGPSAGLASAPVVMLSGGRPPVLGNGGPWSPFDAQGFMAYRLAMMTFASTAFLSLWTLTRRLGGERTARFALLLAVTTPFLVHEIWFTWPKLLAASLVLLSAVSLVDGRPFVAGLLVGAGYLCHPLALLSLPALGLLALWPLASTSAFRPSVAVRLLGAHLPRPQIRPALLLIAAVAIPIIGWRVANGSHYTQSNFLSNLTKAGNARIAHHDLIRLLGGHPPALGLSAWVSDRLESIANTLVPLRLFLFGSDLQSVNSASQACFPWCTGGSPGIVHFFFQYWTGVPFGLAIVFFPLLLQSLWRALRRWTWAFTVAVIVPFLVFAIYWGGPESGLLREGMHAWVLTLLVVVALEQQRERFAWLRNTALRGLLALRSVEVLLVATLPTLVTRHRPEQSRFRLSDIVAVLTMITLSGWLGLLVWRDRAPPTSGSQSSERDRSLANLVRR